MELNELLALIDTNINTKVGDEKITGAIHNMVLHNVVSSLIEITSTGFGGTIGVDDNPGVPVKPIYFLADEKGTYTYCGGVAVSELPSFIAWNGTVWSVKPFSTPQGVGDASQCQGLAKPGDPMPLGKELGDWYVFIGGGRLNWQGLTSNKAGIVYVKSLQGGGTSQVLPVWAPIYFGNDRHFYGLATPDTTPVSSLEVGDYYLVLSAGDYSKFASLEVNSVTGPGILFYESVAWHFRSFGVEGKITEAPADNKSYVRKNRGWAEIPTEPGTGGGLASTWEASVEAIRAIATHETGMDIGDITTGIIYEYDADSMDDDDGANCLLPSNVPSSEAGRWIAAFRVSKYGHKHYAADVNMADGTTAEAAINETRRQAISFSVSIPFTSVMTSMPLTASNAERVFVPIVEGSVSGARCVVVLTANGNALHIPGFDPSLKQSPDSMIWDNTNNAKNTIEFWFDGTTYWYKIVREASNIAYKSEVLLKGGQSGPFTPAHDNDPAPKKWTEDTIRQYIANYYPGLPSPDGQDLGWYGVEWDEGRVNSGALRIGSLSGYVGGGAYGQNGYSISTRPLSNVPEHLLFVHNRIKSVMLADDGTEVYDLDPVNNHNRAGVQPTIFGTVTTGARLALNCTGLFVSAADAYIGRYVHNTTSGKTSRYAMITGKTSNDALVISDPRTGTPASNIFDDGDTFEICTARFDGVDGQAMVKIPKFYFLNTYEPSATGIAARSKVRLAVSLYPYAGFSLHPAFINGTGAVVDAIYISKFEAGLATTKLVSLPNYAVSNNTNFPTFRQRAQARGAGWQLEMFWYRSALQILFYVEYADLFSQLRLPGYTEGSSNTAWLRRTGRTLFAGNQSVSVQADSWYDADIINATGWLEHKTVSMSYRGVENFYGHVFKALDGVNVNDLAVYATNNKAVLASDTSTGYNAMGVNLSATNWIRTLHPVNGAFIPALGGASSVTNYTDYVYSSTGWRVCFSGGSLSAGANAGVATLTAASDSSDAAWYVGARLCF